ncbi:MerR family transcriptional regulator [candidate division KSB1 bacterium]|nr:MerR family transcriptional regulator [candidate division KSB1 bacterium]
MRTMPIQKLYYSISDVSQVTDVKQHVLRYWESEFPELKPTKNRAGNRTFKSRDVKIIFLIKRLLYQEKFTIDGAKNKLRELIQDESKLDEIQFDQTNEHVKTLIQDLRGELLEIEQIITHEDNDRGVAQSG